MKYFGFCVILFFHLACKNKRESTKPRRETIINTVYSSVTIEPNDVYKVNSTFSGNIEEILFDEGDIVKKGDILFILANKPFQLNERNEELNHQFIISNRKN